MARKTKEVTIQAEGRDKGKVFLITEMSASAAERWAFRALNAAARAGFDLDPQMASGGMAILQIIGLRALLRAPYEDLEPLLDEMMACVQSVQPAATRDLIEDDIEEVGTRAFLRDEVFELHVGFSLAAFLSELAGTMRAAPATDENSSDTPT